MKKENKSTNKVKTFIDLTELLYVPAYSVSKSNMRLSASIIELIKSVSTTNPPNTDTLEDQFFELNTINIAYDRIKESDTSDGDETNLETVEVKIPLLSVIPITNLQVNKTKIKFDAEIGKVTETDGKYSMEARVTAEKSRPSDYFPKMEFEMSLESASPTEGIARLLDVLNANPIPKVIKNTAIDSTTCEPLIGKDKENYAKMCSILKQKNKKEKACDRLQYLLEETTKCLANILLKFGIDDMNDFMAQKSEEVMPLLMEWTQNSENLPSPIEMYNQIKEIKKRQDVLKGEIFGLISQAVMVSLEKLEGNYE